MKQSTFTKLAGLSLLMVAFTAHQALAQDSGSQKKVYSTTGGEIIFSGADIKDKGSNANSIVRFSPVFNFQNQLHYDVSNSLGFFTGLNIRNVGFIFDDPFVANTRYKMRSYTLGIPFAIKVGKMDGTCLFAGYELELPFNFKQKKFVNEDKEEKESYWFTDRTPGLYQSVFMGFQGPYGVQLKFKYYMTNFVNQDYAANDGNGNIIHPYAGFKANVFYVSVSFQLLRNIKLYYK
jgi:hypothetical protein